MSCSLLLSFTEDISLIEESRENWVLSSSDVQLPLKQLSSGLLAAIARLLSQAATEEELSSIVLEEDGVSSLPQFYYYLQRFISLGWLCHTLRVDELTLARLIPIATPYPWEFHQIECDRQYVLSRFAYCHRENGEMVGETPLFPGKIVLKDWRSGAIATALANPQNSEGLSNITDLSREAIQGFLSLLLSAKMLVPLREDGTIEEEENKTLVQWEFHDLLFHSKSRQGSHNQPVGKSKRFLGKIEPLPAIKPKISSEIIDLYTPDLEKLKQSDIPFTQVLESRKSIRIQGARSLTEQELGEFLYRCFRVRGIIPKTDMEGSDRPYPSGGASYELEVYLAIHRCENIAAGFYHYCPQDHQLEKIVAMTHEVETLINDAGKATGESFLPQILVILSARFARVSWAYESVAYSLILKHVGVLYQTMYLVATAMDLAPCAIGAGNSTLFATVAGTDYYTESSVGEFILGTVNRNSDGEGCADAYFTIDSNLASLKIDGTFNDRES